ncbi:MAG TPA: Hsp20/alpha crystallin family protein, partial [Polyangiaceae bacterium]
HESGGVYQCERSFGRFMRSIPLPEGASAENVTATFENGVLEVTMPMPKSTQAGRTIPIQPKPKGVTH